jgi:hypothetical protein
MDYYDPYESRNINSLMTICIGNISQQLLLLIRAADSIIFYIYASVTDGILMDYYDPYECRNNNS